jgi:hypothetical protein
LTVVAVEPAAAVTEEDLAASPADVWQVLVDHEPAAVVFCCPLPLLRLIRHVLAVAHADVEAVALLGC